MRSVQPCSAATWTAVRPSSERAHDGQPSASSRRTASARFHAAAQYSDVHPSRSFTSGGDPYNTPSQPSRYCLISSFPLYAFRIMLGSLCRCDG